MGVVVAAVVAGVLLPGTADAIVGGVPASEPYPFTGSVQMSWAGDDHRHNCGASLITPRHALSAAHCFTNFDTDAQRARFGMQADAPDLEDPGLFHIQFGNADRLRGTEVRGVSTISKPPQWNQGQGTKKGESGDVVLLTLDRPITTIPPVAIKQVTPRTSVRHLGWGRHSTDEIGQGPAPRYLHEVDTPGSVRKSADCTAAEIGVDEVCFRHGGTRDQPTGGCYGDSGSPTIQRADGRWYLVGITSRGAGEACATDAVNADPTYYLGWILREVFTMPADAGVAGRDLVDVKA